MPSHTDPNVISDVLLYEVDASWSRDRVTIAAGADLAPGTVLGRITASGKYKLHDPAASDGSQDAVAVLLAQAAAASADVAAPVIARGAVLDAHGLVWKSGITDPQKATARAALLALGLKVIDSV